MYLKTDAYTHNGKFIEKQGYCFSISKRRYMNLLRVTMATSSSLKRKRKLHHERELAMRFCCKDFLQCNLWKPCILNHWREKDGRRKRTRGGGRGEGEGRTRKEKGDYEREGGSKSESKGGGDKRRERVLFGGSLIWKSCWHQRA